MQDRGSKRAQERLGDLSCAPAPRFFCSSKALKLALIFAVAIILPVYVFADEPNHPSQYEIKLPLGIPAEVWSYFVPKDNSLTKEKVELGRELFFDKRLSADGTLSCASCHDPKIAFTDGKRVAEGIGGRRGARNTPTLLNSMFNSSLFWDGRAESLEEQAKLPLINPDEMGDQSYDQIVARVAAVPEYAQQFKQVFGKAATVDLIAKAIAAYERTLVSGNSPLDRFMGGDQKALSDQARRGMNLFRGKARCAVCHTFNQTFASFPFLTDMNYRNTGVGMNFSDFNGLARRAMQIARDDSRPMRDRMAKGEGGSEIGRFLVSGNGLDIGAFRTPSLRNVELTAPYFHDGSAATLADVIRFYLKGGVDNPNRDWQLEPVDLTEDEQRDLIEFLKAPTSDDARRAFESAAVQLQK